MRGGGAGPPEGGSIFDLIGGWGGGGGWVRLPLRTAYVLLLLYRTWAFEWCTHTLMLVW